MAKYTCIFCGRNVTRKGRSATFCHECAQLRDDINRVDSEDRLTLLQDCSAALQLRELRTALRDELENSSGKVSFIALH